MATNRYEEQPRERGLFAVKGDEPLSKKVYGVRVPVSIAAVLESMPDRADWLKRTIIEGVRGRDRPSPPNNEELEELKGKCDRLARRLDAFRKIVLRMPFYTYEPFDIRKPSIIYDQLGRKYKMRGFGDYLDKLDGISTNHPKSGNGIVIPQNAIWKVYETDFDGVLPQPVGIFPETSVQRGEEIARDRGLTKTQLKQARKVGDRLLAKDGSVWELVGESKSPEDREFRCLLAGNQ